MSEFEIDREEMKALAMRLGGEGPWEIACGAFARKMGTSFSRAKSLFYGNARRIDTHEMEKARQLARTAELKAEEAQRYAELCELRARLARLEECLARKDAEFHCETSAVLREQLGVIR